MKYCSHCGKQLLDDAVVCPNCGCQVTQNSTNKSTLRTVAKVFMVIGCLANSSIGALNSLSSEYANTMTVVFSFLIPLAWTIPMTVYYFKHEKVGIAFKICALLFVNLIAGICMLCDKTATTPVYPMQNINSNANNNVEVNDNGSVDNLANNSNSDDNPFDIFK